MILSEISSLKCLNSSQLMSKQVQEPIRYAPYMDAVSRENLTEVSLLSNQSSSVSEESKDLGFMALPNLIQPKKPDI